MWIVGTFVIDINIDIGLNLRDGYRDGGWDVVDAAVGLEGRGWLLMGWRMLEEGEGEGKWGWRCRGSMGLWRWVGMGCPRGRSW